MSAPQPSPRRRGGDRGKGRPPRNRHPSIRIGTYRAANDRLITDYVRQFPIVELEWPPDAIPLERDTQAWIEQTPDRFVIDVVAHRLLTQQPARPESLWSEVRDLLPTSVRQKRAIYLDDVGARVLDATFDRFLASVLPLQRFAKLGTLVFPFPAFFAPSSRSLDYLVYLRDRARDLPLAVEFRNAQWLDSRHRDATLQHLEQHRVALVCVDEPQGFASSVPPVGAVTADLAVVRFRGRNADLWERDDVDDAQRYAYEYRRSDLEPWVGRLERLAQDRRTVHVFMRNAGPDAAMRGARLLRRLLAGEDEARPEGGPRRDRESDRRRPGSGAAPGSRGGTGGRRRPPPRGR